MVSNFPETPICNSVLKQKPTYIKSSSATASMSEVANGTQICKVRPQAPAGPTVPDQPPRRIRSDTISAISTCRTVSWGTVSVRRAAARSGPRLHNAAASELMVRRRLWLSEKFDLPTLSSSSLALPYRILNIHHKKELLPDRTLQIFNLSSLTYKHPKPYKPHKP